jgi:HKD family nuclease
VRKFAGLLSALGIIVAVCVPPAAFAVPLASGPRAMPNALAMPRAIPQPNANALWSPAHYTPHTGPHFNNPYGGTSARRAILRNVDATINSVPGYHVQSRSQCPKDPALWPAEIKISLYSIADMSFVRSLIAADRRCVSVQLLMNDHLNATTSPSWGKLLHAIGGNRSARSFTYRCSNSCRGNSVLHSKFYLFSEAGKAHDVVMVGSSNMTTNASRVQWNDLYTAPGNAQLYSQFRGIFEQMVPDQYVPHAFREYHAAPYTTMFWPDNAATEATDHEVGILRRVRCSGATGGTGINGHTVVYINIHAWHSARGQWFADEARRLYNRGCYVRVLYSFMGHGIFDYLKQGTGSRMKVLRTLFPRPNTDVAAHYSHMKNINISGHVGADTSVREVWTGSNNFTGLGLHSDEVLMRIPVSSIYADYVRHWKLMARRASPVWAIYSEPSGGGRAPDAETADLVVANGGKSPTAVQLRDELPPVDTSGQDMD